MVKKNDLLKGSHLTLDCTGCNSEKISNIEIINHFLNELPQILGMRKIIDPVVLKYEWDNNSWDKGGISAFVMIAESHISIHTFPKAKLLTADIYSCKPFDIEKTIWKFENIFKPTKIKKNIIKREVEIVRCKELAKQ